MMNPVKKQLEPLISMDELKKVLGEIVHAPPEKVKRVKIKANKKGISVKARLRTKTAK